MASYLDINALSKDSAFTGRVVVAITKFMDYILNESTATTNHTKRWLWASAVARSGPESVVGSVASRIAWDSTIQSTIVEPVASSTYTDDQLQSATEAWLGTLFNL